MLPIFWFSLSNYAYGVGTFQQVKEWSDRYAAFGWRVSIDPLKSDPSIYAAKCINSGEVTKSVNDKQYRSPGA